MQRAKRAARNCPTCTETRREQEVPIKIWLVPVVKPESFPAKVGEGTANIFTQRYIAIAPHTPQNNTRIVITSSTRFRNSTKHPPTDVRALTSRPRNHTLSSTDVSRSAETEIKFASMRHNQTMQICGFSSNIVGDYPVRTRQVLLQLTIVNLTLSTSPSECKP